MKRTKKSLKQKLTIALSVVNALNMAAPIALPYVNVAKNVRAEGGQTEPLQDVARAFKLGTEEAYKSGSNPTEGTILTVMRCSAEAAEKLPARLIRRCVRKRQSVVNVKDNAPDPLFIELLIRDREGALRHPFRPEGKTAFHAFSECSRILASSAIKVFTSLNSR